MSAIVSRWGFALPVALAFVVTPFAIRRKASNAGFPISYRV